MSNQQNVKFENFGEILKVNKETQNLFTTLKDIAVLTLINLREMRVTGIFSVILSVFMPVGIVVFLSIAQPNMPMDMRMRFILGNVIISVLQTCVGNLGGRIAQIKWYGGAEYYFVLPIRRVALMYGILLNYLAMTIPGICAVLAAGGIFYHVSYSFSPILLLIFVEMILAFCGIGFFIGMKSKNTGQAVALSQAVSFFLMFLTPVYYSVYALPSFYRVFAQLMPTTYATHGISTVLTGKMGPEIWTDVLALGVFCLISIFIISKSTKWTEA